MLQVSYSLLQDPDKKNQYIVKTGSEATAKSHHKNTFSRVSCLVCGASPRSQVF